MSSKERPNKTRSQSTTGPSVSDTSSMADSPTAPLTTGKLVEELSKLKKDMTTELTALLNMSLEPLRTSVESFQMTLAAQATTIGGIETSMSDHSIRISQLEQDVADMQKGMESIQEENDELKAKVEDLESRSRRQNVRVVGLPESIEGKDARDFMTKLFSSLLGDLLSGPPVLDRAHRSLQPRPDPDKPPRPVIVRFHRYIEKETVLNWAKSNKDSSYQGHKIKIYEDFSTGIAKRRAAFNPVKSLFYKKKVRFGMLYPARLRVTLNNREHVFNTPEMAEAFYRKHFPAK